MRVVDGVVGNLNDDEALAARYDELPPESIERVVVDSTERKRSRFRTTTDRGDEIGVVVDRPDGLRSGDVLSADADGMLVVEFERERAAAIDLPADADPRRALELGYAVGNKHWTLAVEGGTVYVLVPDDENRLAAELDTMWDGDAPIRFADVDPSLFDDGAGRTGHAHTHEHGDGHEHTHDHVQPHHRHEHAADHHHGGGHGRDHE